MESRKSKKSRKQRGSRTHGWGAGKKHRGAGNRGGRGMAGIGKRGQQKKTKYYINGKNPIGKQGMQITRIRPQAKTINLYQIEASLTKWLTDKKIKKEKDVFIINLKLLGYDKVLGVGKLESKLKITAKIFSKAAAERIKAAGGEAITEA